MKQAAVTILEGDGYSIDSNQSSANIIITDLPIVSLSTDKTVVSEGGEPQLITFNFSEPTPAEGLIINLWLDTSDGEPGDAPAFPELFSNIVDFGVTVENGVTVANVRIAGVEPLRAIN
mgnify:CR=1 FL=1